MSGNPLAHRNDVLYAVHARQLGSEGAVERRTAGACRRSELTYRDAKALLASDIPDRTVIMRKARVVMSPPDGVKSETAKPFLVEVRTDDKDFFAMFDVPFKYGAAGTRTPIPLPTRWSCCSKETNEKAFGGENSVGRTVRLDGRDYKVVGVLDEWTPDAEVLRPEQRRLRRARGALRALRASASMLEMQLGRQHQLLDDQEIDEFFQDFLNSDCVWIQIWVELRDAGQGRSVPGISSTTTCASRRSSAASSARSTTSCSNRDEWLQGQRGGARTTTACWSACRSCSWRCACST